MWVQPISGFAGGALLAAAAPRLASIFPRFVPGPPVSPERRASAWRGMELAAAGSVILLAFDGPCTARTVAAATGFLISWMAETQRFPRGIGGEAA